MKAYALRFFLVAALLATLAVSRAHCYSVTVEYYEIVNTPIQISGDLYMASDGSLVDMKGKDPSDPKSYTDQNKSIPTTRVKSTKVVDIPGNMPRDTKDFLAKIAKAIDAAYKEAHNAVTNCDEYGRVSQGILEDGIRISDMNGTRTIAKGELSLNSPVVGDPVRITTGQFVLEETDAVARFGDLSFAITRRYDADIGVSYSAGSGWWSSLDTCVVRGMNADAEGVHARINAKLAEIQALYDRMCLLEETITENFKSYKELQPVYKKILQEQLAALAVWNDPESSDVQRRRLETEDAIADCEVDLFILTRNHDTMIDECRLAVKNVGELLDRVKDLVARDALAYSLYSYNNRMNAPYYGRSAFLDGAYCGNDRILLRDENGNIRVFRLTMEPDYSSSVNYYPWGSKTESKTSGNTSTLELLADGRFLWNREDGTVWQYGTGGSIERITNRFGMSLVFSYEGKDISSISCGGKTLLRFGRNPSGAIARIDDAAGRRCLYDFSGGTLSSVTDFDGDAVAYEYDGTSLSAIRKADKNSPGDSRVTTRYGYQGPSGAMVTATTNEEGGTERFDYDPSARITRHVAPDGEVTTTAYDFRYRPVREEFGDGTVKEYSYGAIYGLLRTLRLTDRDSLTSATISYSYDEIGNRTEAAYSDGTFERWRWNAYRQMTWSRDRDGYCRWFEYSPDGKTLSEFAGMDRGSAILVRRAEFDPYGRMTSERNGERAEVRYEYSPETGYLAKRTMTANGDDIDELFAYDGAGRILSHTDGAGRVTAYEYPDRVRGENRKAVVNDNSGLVRTYEYDSRKDLVRVCERDVGGETRVTERAYDRRHLPLTVTDGSGVVVSYAYRGDGKVTLETRGRWSTAYEYEAMSGRLSAIVRRLADGAGTVISEGSERYRYSRNSTGALTGLIVADPSTPGGERESIVQFDVWGRRIAARNAIGEWSSRESSGAGRLLREQASEGGRYEYGYDGVHGMVSAYGGQGKPAARVMYNADGSIREITDRNGNLTEFGYDGRGLVIRERSPRGERTWTHDAAGRVVREDERTNAGPDTPASSAYTEWIYGADDRSVAVVRGGRYETRYSLNGWGEVVSVTDGEGNERTLSYDGAGRLSKETDPYGHETSYFWNDIGKIAAIVYPDGNRVSYEYDHFGNTAKITDGCGTAWEGEYDECGRLTRERGRPGIDRSYLYDAIDRVVEVRSGGALAESYEYGERGRTTLFRDGSGRSYAYFKDEFGDAVGERDRRGLARSREIDGEGRLVSSIGFGGKLTRVTHDDANGRTSTDYSDGTSSRVCVDLGGNVIRASGETGSIAYEYDEGGMLVRQTDETAGETISYAYDRAGRKTGMACGNRAVSYEYGKNGELLSAIDVKQGLSVRNEYDSVGNLVSRLCGNGTRQDMAYDPAGRARIVREFSPSGAIVRAEGYLYDEAGRRELSFDRFGNVTAYEYDDQSRIKSVSYPYSERRVSADREECEGAGQAVLEKTPQGMATFLPADDVKRIRDIMDEISPVGGNALRVVQSSWSESFSYDSRGNRSSKTTAWGAIPFVYDPENRLLSKGTIVYSYDDDGNLLSEKGLRKSAMYEYTEAGRMKTSIVLDEVNMTRTETRYRYDAFGRRTLVQDAGRPVVRTVYDGLGFDPATSAISVSDGSLTTDRSSGATRKGYGDEGRYVWISGSDSERSRFIDADGYADASNRFVGSSACLRANGTDVAVNRSASIDSSGFACGGVFYSGFDALGSVRTVTDASGSPESAFEYDAFGKPVSGDFSSGISPGYTGKPFDPVTGLYDYGCRDYSPETARFTTVDPVRDGTNWFAYVNNDPVNFKDPDGLQLTITVDKDRQSITATLTLGGISMTEDFGDNSVTTGVVSHNSIPNADTTRTQSNGTNPTQFPNGTSNITGISKTSDQKYGDKWITTDATQKLITTKGSTVVDSGYYIHYSPYTNTNGCIGVKEKNTMDALLAYEKLNERLDPGTSKITVIGGSTQPLTDKSMSANTDRIPKTGGKND